jgi:hypothetical protein
LQYTHYLFLLYLSILSSFATSTVDIVKYLQDKKIKY